MLRNVDPQIAAWPFITHVHDDSTPVENPRAFVWRRSRPPRQCLSCAITLPASSRSDRSICDACRQIAVANSLGVLEGIRAPFLDLEFYADETDVLRDHLGYVLDTAEEVEAAIATARDDGRIVAATLLENSTPFGICEECGDDFQPKRSTARLCPTCRNSTKNQRYRKSKLGGICVGCNANTATLLRDRDRLALCKDCDEDRKWRAECTARLERATRRQGSIDDLLEAPYNPYARAQGRRLEDYATALLFQSDQKIATEYPVQLVNSKTGEWLDISGLLPLDIDGTLEEREVDEMDSS